MAWRFPRATVRSWPRCCSTRFTSTTKPFCCSLKNDLLDWHFHLVRRTFETFVRRVWLRHCASEKEVENFAKGKINEKTFGALIDEIEAQRGYQT